MFIGLAGTFAAVSYRLRSTPSTYQTTRSGSHCNKGMVRKIRTCPVVHRLFIAIAGLKCTVMYTPWGSWPRNSTTSSSGGQKFRCCGASQNASHKPFLSEFWRFLRSRIGSIFIVGRSSQKCSYSRLRFALGAWPEKPLPTITSSGWYHWVLASRVQPVGPTRSRYSLVGVEAVHWSHRWIPVPS